MRIVHTADWHLGRIFQGHHLTEDQSHVLDALYLLLKDAQPDALVIAGDIYDRAIPPPQAVALFDDFLSRVVHGLNLPVLAIAGNHDSPERVGFGSKVFEHSNVYLRGVTGKDFSPVTLVDDDGPVHFALVPYAEPQVVRDVFGGEYKKIRSFPHGAAMQALVERHARELPLADRAICIAHGSVVGAYECESERPLWVSQAGYAAPSMFHRFAFTALGHFHKAQKVNVLTKNEPWLEYSGSLLKYSFSEHNQTKSVNVIDIDARGGIKLERVPLIPKHDVRVFEGDFERLLHGEKLPFPESDYLKLTLTDLTPVLDAITRLKARYKNLLALEQPALFAEPAQDTAPREAISLDPAELFKEFYKNAAGRELSDEELEVLAEVLGAQNTKSREAA